LEWILYSPYEVANQSIYNSRLIPWVLSQTLAKER
jgi:hypothetical protein